MCGVARRRGFEHRILTLQITASRERTTDGMEKVTAGGETLPPFKSVNGEGES